MGLTKKASTLLKGVAGKILALDDTTPPISQFDAITDISLRHRFSLKGKKLNDVLNELKKKHLIDSVTVANRNGSTIASTNGDNVKEAITGTALFYYIQSELPKSETILIKRENDWFMVLPFKENIFIVKAASDISSLELKAMAKELSSFLE